MRYDDLEFNPMSLEKDELIWEKYPDLAINPSFSQLSEEDYTIGYTFEDLSQVVSFVILYVDQDSPFYKELDIDRRIKGCCKVLNIKRGSLVYEQIENHSPKFSDVMHQYFVWVNNIPFEGYISLKTTMHELYKYLRTPLSKIDGVDLEADRRSKVQQRLLDLKKELMEVQSKLFPSKRIQNQIIRENTKKELTAYAERHARHHPILNAQQ